MDKRIFLMRKPVILLTIVILLFSLSIKNSLAQEDVNESFMDFVIQLEEEGVIPISDRKIMSLGDYEDSLAFLGNFQGTPLLEADNFVISMDLSWSSGSNMPNSMDSGCGVFFGMDNDATDYLMISARMDGILYFSGFHFGNYLNYGQYMFSVPSVESTGKLTVVKNEEHVEAYLNGNSILKRNNIPAWGSVIGLSVLSGTNQDFGTRCSFTDILFYTWE